ncbi:MAG: hypothetical protein K0R82_657 [Flavipsychrobacter sp.]|nr:hypothetical protein [Flavipsychrobacter sp.]
MTRKMAYFGPHMLYLLGSIALFALAIAIFIWMTKEPKE